MQLISVGWDVIGSEMFRLQEVSSEGGAAYFPFLPSSLPSGMRWLETRPLRRELERWLSGEAGKAGLLTRGQTRMYRTGLCHLHLRAILQFTRGHVMVLDFND